MHSNLKPLALNKYPAAKLKIGEKVHVLGWARGAVFRIEEICEGMAIISKPSQRDKRFTVSTNRLTALKN